MDQSETRTEMETDQSDSPVQSENSGSPSEDEDTTDKTESAVNNEDVTDNNNIDSDNDTNMADPVANSPDSDDGKEMTESAKIQPMSPRRRDVMKRLNFPADLLTLRQVDESEFLQTGIPWSITTQVPVSQGSTIGPYKGETIALSSIKPGELVLQVGACVPARMIYVQGPYS